MTTGILYPRQANHIVNYKAVTKQTKWLDIASAVSISAGTVDVKFCSAKFTRDSSGTWAIEASGNINLTGDADLSGVGSQSITIAGITCGIRTSVDNLCVSNATAMQLVGIQTSVGSNNLGFTTTSTTVRYIRFSFKAILSSEPTWASLGTTASAAMEAFSDISVYIEPASAGVSGIVNNAASNTAGTPIKGKTDGVAVAAGYVGEVLTAAGTASYFSTQLTNGGVSFNNGTQLNNYILYKSDAVGDAIKLALGAGVWRIEATVCWADSTGTAAMVLTLGSGNAPNTNELGVSMKTAKYAIAAGNGGVTFNLSTVDNFSAARTYHISSFFVGAVRVDAEAYVAMRATRLAV